MLPALMRIVVVVRGDYWNRLDSGLPDDEPGSAIGTRKKAAFNRFRRDGKTANMICYIIRRLLFAVPTRIAISFIVFALLDLAPNDPTGQLPLTIPPEVRAQIRESLGLGRPFHVRYVNMNWLTGFDGWSFYTPQAVLVHRDEASLLWFGRAQDARSASITTHLPAANIVAFSESLVHHRTGHPFDELCELIRQRGGGRPARANSSVLQGGAEITTTTIHHNNGNFPGTRRFPDCSVIPGNPSTEYSGQISWGSNETKRQTTPGAA